MFLVLEHERRRIVHFNVTEGPSAQWTGQQLVNAFPDDSAPKHVIRDRDKIYGADFVRRVRAMGIEQVLTAPRSPWQNPYCERVIGTLRRDCLDHVIVLSEQHLRRIVRNYLEYYHGSRTHLALDKDTPEIRQRESPDGGKVIAVPPQNLVQRAIVDVSALGVKLADALILHLLCALLATTSDRQHKRECHCVHGPSRNCQ